MGERSVAKVVHQPSHRHVSYVILAHRIVIYVLRKSLALPFFDLQKEVHLFLGEVANAEAMRESGVRGTWEY